MAREDIKEQIVVAFMEIAETQSIESIRVNDIIRHSGVSKATFYRHFHDKYDVMNWVYQRVVDPAVVVDTPGMRWIDDTSHITLSYIKEHKKFFRNIVSYHGQNSFSQFMETYFSDNLRRSIQSRLNQTELSEELEFAIAMTGNRGAFATEKWIRDNCRIEEDVLLDYIRGFIPDCLRPFYQIKETEPSEPGKR